MDSKINNKPNIIFIDDEIRILRSLSMIFRRTHNVYITSDPDEFRRIIREKHIHVIVCDQRMPVVTGTQLLSEAKKISPLSIRLLLTGYADLNAVIDSINEGEIYRYITKPWDSDQLKAIIQEATDIALGLANSDPSNFIDGPSIVEKKLGLMVMFESRNIYQRFQRQFGQKFDIYWAKDINTTMKILNKHDISLVITDVHYCNQEILPVVNALKMAAPDILTLIVTQHQDSRHFIDLINQGQIFRVLVRPITAEQLTNHIDDAAERHQYLKANPELQQQFKVEDMKTKNSSPSEQISAEEDFDGLLDKIRSKFG